MCRYLFFPLTKHVRHNFFLVIFIFRKSPFIFLFSTGWWFWCCCLHSCCLAKFFLLPLLCFVLCVYGFFPGPRHRWTWLCILMRIWNAFGEASKCMWADAVTVNVIRDSIFFFLFLISTKCIRFFPFISCVGCSCVWMIPEMLNALL